MISLAKVTNSRIYIHLNRRSYKQISLKMLSTLALSIESDEIYSLHKLYYSVCGKYKSSKDKTWVIDIDKENLEGKIEEEFFNKFYSILYEIEPINRIRKVEAVILTKNGWHIITPPFNSLKFSNYYPDIQIHKNNPTLLWCN